MALEPSTNILYNFITADNIKLFVSFDASTGTQIGAKYKSTNSLNWVGDTSYNMIIEETKIYISYHWVESGILVFDKPKNILNLIISLSKI